MQNETLKESFLAYDVYTREVNREGYTEISVEDRLGLPHTKGFYNEFYANSIVSYALECGRDPIEAIEKAKKNNHDLHWLNPKATAITSHKQDKKKLIEIKIGMRVKFQGLYFVILKADNNNLTLSQFVPAK